MATIAEVSERPARPQRPFAPWHRRDRNVIAGLIVYVWLGILAGFGSDIADHVANHRPAFPLIVHIHAVAFLGWLVLFTVQAGLIRTGRAALHRRLGFAMLALAAFMLFIGPATALQVDRLQAHAPDADPNFVFIQMGDMLAFAMLTGAGVALRARPAAHKRLMLLSLLYISDAGFGRALGAMLTFPTPFTFWFDFAGDYLLSDLGTFALGIHDLLTRRRLHPAYVAGILFVLAMQFAATWGHVTPALRPLALGLIGA